MTAMTDRSVDHGRAGPRSPATRSTPSTSGDWEKMRALLTSDARYHEFGTQRKIEGPEQIIELFKGWKTAFPDAAGTVTNSVASGNTAVLEVTWKGTHTGPLVTAGRNDPGLRQAARRRPLPSSTPSRAARSRQAATTSTR